MKKTARITAFLMSIFIFASCVGKTSDPVEGDYVINIEGEEFVVHYKPGGVDEDAGTETEKETEAETVPEYEYLVDVFADVDTDKWFKYSGTNGEGKVFVSIPGDYKKDVNGLYLRRNNINVNEINMIYDNEVITRVSLRIKDNGKYSGGDTFTVSAENINGIKAVNEKLLEYGFYISETEREYVFPDMGTKIEKVSQWSDDYAQAFADYAREYFEAEYGDKAEVLYMYLATINSGETAGAFTDNVELHMIAKIYGNTVHFNDYRMRELIIMGDGSAKADNCLEASYISAPFDTTIRDKYYGSKYTLTQLDFD